MAMTPEAPSQQRRLGQAVGVIDLYDLDLEGLAAALDAEPEADIIGIDQFLVGAQEMHQGDLAEPGLGGAVAGARAWRSSAPRRSR